VHHFATRLTRLALLTLLFSVSATRAAFGIVISEIHYNPAGPEESLEFVEVSNETSTPEDISGWYFTDGITYEFRPGTILEGGESIVVCADVAELRRVYGINNAVGNFVGRLENNGERLTLANQVGIEISSLRFRDEGKWPVGADGSGHTLTLRDWGLDPSEPESWKQSRRLGGSPGGPEGEGGGGDPGDPGGPSDEVLLDDGDTWRFARGAAPFSPGATDWRDPDFDDSSWDEGPSGFGFADNDDETVLGDMRNNYSTVACRAAFTLTADDLLRGTLTLGVRYDDGFCAYVNGVEVASSNCPETVAHDALATTGHEATDEELFEIPSAALVAGENVIAVIGLNVTIDSTDFSIAPRVLISRSLTPVGGSGFPLDEGDDWRFRRGTSSFSTGSPAWFEPDFNDAGWETGAAGFGYDDDDDQTVLGDMRSNYSSVACRASFTLAAADLGSASVSLVIRYDDGFCAYINGVEFASSNCPAGVPFDGLATAGHEATGDETFSIPSRHLVAGANVIAVVGFNVTIDSTDFSLLPRVHVERPTPPEPTQPVFNELHRSVAGDSWFELYNPNPTSYPLDGLRLSTDADDADSFAIPAGQSIPAGGFWSITASESGLNLSTPEVRLILEASDGRVIDARAFDKDVPAALEGQDYSEALYPDGHDEVWITTDATRDTANSVDATTDVVINEIYYHPPEDRDGEFLELLNRGTRSIDISGFALDRGVDFPIPEGTTLGPGELLVIAGDPDVVESQQGIDGVLGPWTGRLANSGERIRLVDALGNLADEVRYFDGGRWSLWADGRGSSLELIDPNQPNDVASAWTHSDESDKSTWERLSYTVTDFRRASESELHLLLVERGACLIDDVSVRRGGGSNHIPNGSFESSTTPWIIEGTHHRSRRVTWDARVGNACLELDASGKGDTTANRIEVETSPGLSNGEYTVSLWARWLRGSSTLVAHGEFTAGPWGGRPGPSQNMSGNTLGGRWHLTVPTDLGTPGRRNSQFESNLGPVISDVSHAPASPTESTPVEVVARVADSDGIDQIVVKYREGHPNGAFSTLPLTLRSKDVHGAIYNGELPGFARNRKVVFYIEAEDTRGATRRFPVDAPDRTLLFQVAGEQDASIDSVDIILDDNQNSELRTRRLHSNDLVDGTYVFNDREIFYNVGVRHRGSPWGRPERTSYRVRLAKDRYAHSGLRAVNLSSRANGPVEAASYFLTGRAGTTEKPASVPIYRFVRSRINGSSLGIQRFIQPVDRVYLSQWFPGSDGPALKAVARLAFSDSGQHRAYDGCSFDYMGTNSENYRFYWFHVANQTRDDWDEFAEFMRVMDPRSTSNSQHDAQIHSILDVEGFLRVMVPRVFVSDWDTLGIGQGHNAYMVYDTNDGLWETLPFDYNQAMPLGQVNFPVFPTFDRGWARLIARPSTRRIYLRIASELLSGYWSTTTAGPWLSAMERNVGISMNEVRSFVSQRSNVIRNAIDDFSDVPLRIITNSGRDITTAQSRYTLEGEAPVEVAAIVYTRNGGPSTTLEPTWETPTRWEFRFDVPSLTNNFSFLAFDTQGNILGSFSITITNTSATGSAFTRGDANGDRDVDVSDAVRIVRHLFLGADNDCSDAFDVDDNGEIEITDSIRLLDHLFRGGDAPPAPFPSVGEDVTEDDLADCKR